MRTLTPAEQALLAGGHYRVHLRVLVKDAAGDWQDLSQFEGEDWIVSARLDDDIDFPVAQAEVVLAREGPAGSVAPFMASPLNIPGPLIDAGRELKIETQITAVDATPDPAGWRTVFHGHIDHVSWPRRESRVTVRARDLGGTLLDTWIETEAVYGSEAGTPIETVMQQLLDATLGAGVVQLVVPQSPGFLITPYTQEPMSLLEALQRLADLIGWTVRYRWHEASGAFRLTFYEPPRDNTTPVAVIGPDQYIDVEDLAIDRAGIRNVVSVSYRNAATGQRAEVVVSDATSIARYGRRWMQIQEADTSPIDTQAEAQRLANAALSDLALPHAEQEAEMHYWWPVEIGDLLRFQPNGVHYSDPQDWAVVAWRHELAVGRARTWIRTRGKPAGAYRRWFLATRDRIGAPAVTPTLDEDRRALYLHPHRNEFAGSVRYVVRTTAEPTLAQVRAGTVSAAERILVHTFSDTGQEQRVYVGVPPYRRANGTGAEGGMVVLAYTYRPGNDVPVVTWFPITPSQADREAVRLVVNDDGDQVALFYRTYQKGTTPPAFTRVPASGWANDPLVHDVEVTTPAAGAQNVVLEAYGEDDEGRRTARTVVIEFDHGEAPSGEFQLEVDEAGRVWLQINTLDPDTGSARARIVKGAAGTPAYEALTFTDDADASDGKVELARTVSAFADRIDTGLELAQGEAAYLVGRFFRTLSTAPAAQQASRASDELRVWRSRGGGGGGGGVGVGNYVRLSNITWLAGKFSTLRLQLTLEVGDAVKSLRFEWGKNGLLWPQHEYGHQLTAQDTANGSVTLTLRQSNGAEHAFSAADFDIDIMIEPYSGDLDPGTGHPTGTLGSGIRFTLPGTAHQTAGTIKGIASGTGQIVSSDVLVAPAVGGLKVAASSAGDVAVELDDRIHSLGSVSGTVTPDFANGRVQEMTLTGTTTIANPLNVRPGATYILIIAQDGTGNRAVSWGSAYKWPNGSAPNLATPANTVHVVSLVARSSGFIAAVAQRSFA